MKVTIDPTKFDNELAEVAYKRMVKAMTFVENRARSTCPIGTITRPMYKTGPYAGLYWTARDRGALKQTVRLREKRDKDGYGFAGVGNVRVYVGNRKRYYARIVEFYTPFLRPALNAAKSQMKSIMGVK